MTLLFEKYKWVAYLGAVLIIMGYVQWQRNDAAAGAAAECQADVLSAELADIKQKLTEARAAAAAQKTRADITEQQLQTAETDSASLKAEIARLGNGGNIPPGVRDRLRGILGK